MPFPGFGPPFMGFSPHLTASPKTRDTSPQFLELGPRFTASPSPVSPILFDESTLLLHLVQFDLPSRCEGKGTVADPFVIGDDEGVKRRKRGRSIGDDEEEARRRKRGRSP